MTQMTEERVAQITEALEAMDHRTTNDWNEDGTPKLSVVRGYAKDQTITQEEIDEVGPGWRRQEPTMAELKQLADAEGDDEVEAEADGETDPRVRPDGVQVIDFSKIPPERLEGLKAYKPELQRMINDQMALRDNAINRLSALNYEMDELTTAIARLDRPVSHNSEVRRFLVSQNEQRIREAKNREQIGAALGIKLAAYATPLDAAQARGYSPHGGSKKRAPMGPAISGRTLDLGRIDMRVGAGAGVR